MLGIQIVNFSRRLFRQVALSLIFVALSSSAAHAHGSLISSVPVNNSVVSRSPEHVHLVFSEPIEAGMSRLILVSRGASTQLSATQDPHNVNALVAPLDSLSAGSYEIRWQILSADGHAVAGVVRFSVGAESTQGAVDPHPESDTEASNHSGITRLAMLMRGFGMTSLMALAGFLLFASRAEPDSARNHFRLATTLAVIVSLSFIVHFLVWWWQAAALGAVDFAGILQTSAGRREAIRTGFAILVFWAWWLARRPGLALLLCVGGIISSAFIGHSAAVSPAASISLKTIHLLVASVWLGGLVWILMLNTDGASFRDEVKKVSRAAGWCAFLVLVSGIIQTGILLSWRQSAITSSYALVAGLKLLGVVILIGIGAVNRFRIIPGLDSAFSPRNLQRLVGREISIMVIVALLGGVLSYLSPPDPTHIASSSEIRK